MFRVRLSVLLLMLFAMLWQPVAFAQTHPTSNSPSNLKHTLLHWIDAAHHHHHDGSHHIDTSSESVQHVHADNTSASSLLVPLGSRTFFPAENGSLAVAGDHLPANAPLDGLFRPPRS